MPTEFWEKASSSLPPTTVWCFCCQTHVSERILLFEAGRSIFSLCTCWLMVLTPSLELRLAPVLGEATQASGWLNYSSWASNTFWQAFVAVGGGGRQLPTKPLVRTAVCFTADIIPIVLQSLGWFTGLIGPEPSPSSLLAINQSGELQRWNSLFCETSQNSEISRAYVLSKAWRSQGLVSALPEPDPSFLKASWLWD